MILYNMMRTNRTEILDRWPGWEGNQDPRITRSDSDPILSHLVLWPVAKIWQGYRDNPRNVDQKLAGEAQSHVCTRKTTVLVVGWLTISPFRWFFLVGQPLSPFGFIKPYFFAVRMPMMISKLISDNTKGVSSWLGFYPPLNNPDRLLTRLWDIRIGRAS